MKALPLESSAARGHGWRDDVFRLTVAGLVSKTLQFSLQDLHLNFTEKAFTDPGSERKPLPRGEESWSGCSLNELLEFVGVSSQARHVEFVCWQYDQNYSGLRPFSVTVPITDLERAEIGLVWAQAGEPLSNEQGGPLWALLPGLDGYQQLPAVSRINLVIIPSHNRGRLSPALAG